MPSWFLRNVSKTYVRKFGAHLLKYQLQFNKNDVKTGKGLINYERGSLKKILDETVSNVKSEVGYLPGDKMRIIAKNEGFNHPISTATDTNISAINILDQIENIVTSNEKVDALETQFEIQIFKLPRGSGRKKIINLTNNKCTKRSIVQIKNKDNLCGARAVITALTYHKDKIFEKDLSKNDKKNIRFGRTLQTNLAKQLCALLDNGAGGGSYDVCGFSLADFRKIEELFDVQIKIVCAENFNRIIYSGSEKPITLFLYKNKNHYDVITTITGFYGSSYYCNKCDKCYNNKTTKTHKCKDTAVCVLCKQPSHNPATRNKIYCKDCNRYCFNNICKEKHSTVCSSVYKCLSCSRLCNREGEHRCGFKVCRNCKEFVETSQHQCYMMKKESKGGIDQNTYTTKYIFFDYEAMQNTGVHIPNLIIARDFDNNKFVFKNNVSFCEWLLSEKHRGYTFVAHNAKAYDSYFILKYCIENSIKPFTIYNGTKLMLLEISQINLKIIDSSNFIAGPLAAFPKTFGLKELKKGYFPHFFNIPENQNYVGTIPDAKYYGPDTMKPKQREEFLIWHTSLLNDENYVFDFQRELHDYCDSDVDILRRGCLEFRKEFLEIANIDPLQFITIASVCMAIYRSKYLPEKTIAVVEESHKDTFSRGSITWLNRYGSNVRHALNGGEVTIFGAKVDGYDNITKTIYQYHGCFWHGCPKCYNSSTLNHVNNETMDDLREKTEQRTQKLRNAGYTVVEIWECDWTKSKEYKDSKEIEYDEYNEPLNPRKAFFGGRTNATKLKVTDKKMQYIDVVSLYPTVQYYDPFPIGHPIKILKPSEYDFTWFGLVKCKILPPRNLYHPVLPMKTDKLTFTLCNKCLQQKSSEVCNHTDKERMISGCWTTLEVNKALEKGYKIQDIHEVWHFPEKSTHLFREYIKDFMKIKLETSPHQYGSNENYARVIKEHMGIDLNIDKIGVNPGKRAVAKICLNSLWGKFGQRLNMSQSEFVTDPKRWYEILLDDKIDICNCIFISEDVVQVTYKYKDVFVEDSTSTNIFIAAFTTSNARLRLYDMLDRLGEEVVYYDTDSIVYIDNGHNTVPTGSMLGDWSSELENGDYIIKWLSTGPKSYYYKTLKGFEVTKIKGFTLNYENGIKLNSETLNDVIIGTRKNVVLEFDQITRQPNTKEIVTKKHVSKVFRMDYKKRKLDIQNYETTPFGF